MKDFLPPLNGLLLLDKPKGVPSNFAMVQVQRRLKQAKAGHGGTLDALASGILPIFFGSWTKLSKYCLGSTKRYRAIIRLGIKTDSGDSTGKVIQKLPVEPFKDAQLTLLADSMIGRMEQIPPAFSAIKVAGVPSYTLAAKARKNQTRMKELPPRWIEILQLSMRAIDSQHIDMTITTSKGAYIRSISEMVAQRLNTCGHLVALRRNAVGHLGIDEAVAPRDVRATGNGWIEIERLLPQIPRLHVEYDQQRKIINGQAIPIDPKNITHGESSESVELTCATICALSSEGEVVAIGTAVQDTENQLYYQPNRVLMQA